MSRAGRSLWFVFISRSTNVACRKTGAVSSVTTAKRVSCSDFTPFHPSDFVQWDMVVVVARTPRSSQPQMAVGVTPTPMLLLLRATGRLTLTVPLLTEATTITRVQWETGQTMSLPTRPAEPTTGRPAVPTGRRTISNAPWSCINVSWVIVDSLTS